MSQVRVIDASYVPVPATAAPPPVPIKLNALEAQWVTFFPVLQHVLLFDLDGADHMPPFGTVLECLRSSLAATLVSFAPLAGELVHLDDEGTGSVGLISRSASDGGGVRFVIAECDADIQRLAGDEDHDISVLRMLVPEVDMSELPAKVLAVQATRFEGGGLAIGVTVHHAVADGLSLWTFVEAWAAACRGETPVVTPMFDRSLVKLPSGGEFAARRAVHKYPPDLPLATDVPFTRRWTFTLEEQDIQRLKMRITHLGESHGASLAPPLSSFTVVVALVWTCFARCKPFAASDEVLFFFFADARSRLDPLVEAGYIGACLTGCLMRLPARELHAEHAMAAAASAVQDEVRKMTKDPMAGCDFLAPLSSVAIDHLMHVSGSSRFRAYEVADFGWGKPRRTENAGMNHDGQVALMRARDGHGVQVTVSLLQPPHMEEFKSVFLKLLQV